MRANTAMTVLTIAAICLCGCHRDVANIAPTLVGPNTNPAVELLVEQLVSPVPAKYPSGEWERVTNLENIEGFIHPQVEKAREQLIAKGTEIYPILAEHIHDDRYSYSGVYAAWVNNSVGTMIADIMAEGIEPHLGGYKGRKNPTGSNGHPSFGEMVRKLGGFEKYAAQAQGRSKTELRKDYIQWHIAKERSYGFIDHEQERKVIGEYLKMLEQN
jgi:hypothetical protein